MSSQYRKIKFDTQGNYGSTDKEYLYIRYNGTSDIVEIFDQRGNQLLTFDEWGEFDMGQALVVALTNFEDKRLEIPSLEEIQSIFK